MAGSWPAAWRPAPAGGEDIRRRDMVARRLVQSGGAGAHGSAAQSRVRAARGEQQCGGGDGATNERGNS